MKRLFIAISAKNPLGQTFLPTQKKLKINADQKEIEVKWTPPDNFHVTVTFLGEREDKDVETIKHCLNQVAVEQEQFDLKVHGMGAFPELSHGRVLWLGVQNKKSLHELKSRLDQQLNNALGTLKSDQDYVPHLTVGRLRNPKNLRDFISPYVRKDFGKIHVESLALYESIQAGPFPIYKPIYVVGLGGKSNCQAE